MILQSLASYHERKGDTLAPPGWIRKPVDFVIVINRAGEFVTVNDLREVKNKKQVGLPKLLPNIGKQAQKHANSGKDANLLWDDAPFVLARKTKGPITTQSFCDTVEEYFPDGGECAEDEGIAAIKAFCRTQLADEAVRERIAGLLPQKNGVLLPVIVAFRLDDESECFISDRPAVKQRLAAHVGSRNPDGVCSVTGERAPISRLHTVIKNVWGGQSSGVSLVSYNAPAFNSYNKEGGANAPVGEAAMFAYTTALNHLLGGDSAQRMQVGDASTVFWSEKSSEFEGRFAQFFTGDKDDPDALTDLVRGLYDSIHRGRQAESDDVNRFYVLGLSPNAARVAVRFWIVGSVAEMERNIGRYFEDIKIAHGPNAPDELPLSRLLAQTAVLGKRENIPPNLAGDVMRAILGGTPYPLTAMAALLRRVRAERVVPHARAAFLKACINRSPLQEDDRERKMAMGLDRDNVNIGYRLGRLFAALEKTQLDALPGIKATIRDRFYGSASSTPAAVFPTLIRTSKHHLGKLDDRQRKYRERLIGEIVDGLPPEFPDVLKLSDQGRFAIGYYHQMQDFFTKKTPTADEKAEATGRE
ncbi:MAG: type I-C CRISPR-associated protein Cas8c/Csd1 [Planctomycetota bacterium]|jgi:CRISPR-associated protein Csd1|nr:type I-C CRISPR-associated protein Cas8c/Csd1 [Planctomycetota bacterium]